jgi:putative transposase
VTASLPCSCGDFVPGLWYFFIKIAIRRHQMDQDAKREIAVFRFGVISDLVGRKLNRGEKELILKEKSSSRWEIPFSTRSRISRSTILSWVRAYEKGGRRLESLIPDERRDKGRHRVMDEEAISALVNLKKDRMGVSLPVLLKEARSRGILPARYMVSCATIYRIFKKHGLSDSGHLYPDRRRFESELPNDIWQSDALHGPRVLHDGKMKKTFLFAFIDDMSRLAPHGEFYLNERIDCYIDALTKALSKRGLPRKLYVDNGPAFSTQILRHAMASLGIALVHSRPYEPEGRGKVERFFRTVRGQFLSTIPDGLSLEELNARLKSWIDEYHLREHGSTKESPLSRYAKHLHCVREAPKDLTDYFRKRVTRKVDKDRTVSLDGRLYEAPVAMIGLTVTLLYHENDPTRVELLYNGTSHGMLVPLNVNINARVKRAYEAVDLVPEREYTEDKERYRGGRVFEKEEP